MNMSNLISVIMPVKDASATLKDSIESVLNQSYKDFEFLILDDFSVDSSMEIIQRYKELDSRIKVFKNKKNLGLTKSLNKLVSKSCGNFIARQDSDDISLTTRFEKQVSTLLNSDYKFVVCILNHYKVIFYSKIFLLFARSFGCKLQKPFYSWNAYDKQKNFTSRKWI